MGLVRCTPCIFLSDWARLYICALLPLDARERTLRLVIPREQEVTLPERVSSAQFCGETSRASDLACIVTMQYDHSIDTCVVCMADTPPWDMYDIPGEGDG